MEEHFTNLQGLIGDMHAGQRLPAAAPESPCAARAPPSRAAERRKAAWRPACRAARPWRSARRAAPAPAPAQAGTGTGDRRGVRPPLPHGLRWAQRRVRGLLRRVHRAAGAHQGAVAFCLDWLAKGRPTYEEVGAGLGGIPWAFIGVIHCMEASFNFAGHLHNGDPRRRARSSTRPDAPKPARRRSRGARARSTR
jgi:hypothetical protein